MGRAEVQVSGSPATEPRRKAAGSQEIDRFPGGQSGNRHRRFPSSVPAAWSRGGDAGRCARQPGVRRPDGRRGATALESPLSYVPMPKADRRWSAGVDGWTDTPEFASRIDRPRHRLGEVFQLRRPGGGRPGQLRGELDDAVASQLQAVADGDRSVADDDFHLTLDVEHPRVRGRRVSTGRRSRRRGHRTPR